MTAAQDSFRRLSRLALPVLLLGAAAGALASSVGGQTFPVFGSGRITVKGAGIDPVEVIPNLRFDFDGSPADASGTGLVRAYNAAGSVLIGQFPISWTASGAALQVTPDAEAFAGFLEDRIQEATGGTAAVTLGRVSFRGTLRENRTVFAMSVKATGQASLDGGVAAPMKAKLRGR